MESELRLTEPSLVSRGPSDPRHTPPARPCHETPEQGAGIADFPATALLIHPSSSGQSIEPQRKEYTA